MLFKPKNIPPLKSELNPFLVSQRHQVANTEQLWKTLPQVMQNSTGLSPAEVNVHGKERKVEVAGRF